MKVTKASKLLNALKQGDELTAAQISQRFGAGNPAAEVARLREQGYAIYANQRTDTKGRTTTKYRLGTPSRAVVAAGFKAMRSTTV